MLRLVVNPAHPEPRKLGRAAEVLARGGIIAYPTDTVYGLGCDYADRQGIERLYALKGMNARQPLAFMLPDLGEIARFAAVSDRAYRLMRRLVPGPYTFVLEATREVPRSLITDRRRRTVGVRVADHPVAMGLLRAHGRPIVSTSALGEEHVGLGDPDAVRDRYGKGLDLLVDGGPTGDDVSTVLSMVGDELEILRVGKGAVGDLG